MMKNKRINLVLCVVVMVAMWGCGLPGGNNTGSEYMPEMTHSTAYEANTYNYYHYNTWGGEEAYYEMAKPRKPVAHTIPRGYAGIAPGDMERKENMQGLEWNGFVPYDYEDTEEERIRASEEIITNPYPITDAALEDGQALYTIYCSICHGPNGDGEGWLISEKNANAVYPAQPAILTSDDFIAASNGQLYHAIMYGKNVMGGYADKLSYEERWNVIHYVRSLQAGTKELVYNATENTLDKGALPYESWKLAHGPSSHDETQPNGNATDAEEQDGLGEEDHGVEDEHDSHEH